jgi:hypothetical protein
MGLSALHYITFGPFGRRAFVGYLRLHGGMLKGEAILTIPGMTLLLKDIKTLEDYARAYLSKEEERMVLVTREEADVLESFRRFRTQEND